MAGSDVSGGDFGWILKKQVVSTRNAYVCFGIGSIGCCGDSKEHSDSINGNKCFDCLTTSNF
jgi:hypothetical protein